jgi:transcriptional regulator with XRE-family HTH domain
MSVSIATQGKYRPTVKKYQGKTLPMGKKVSVNISSLWSRIAEAFEGLSVQDIADRLGLSYHSVYKWQHGKHPGLDTLIRISEVTSCSIHWLLTGTGPKRIDQNHINSAEPAILVKCSEAQIDIIRALAEQINQTPTETIQDLLSAGLLFVAINRQIELPKAELMDLVVDLIDRQDEYKPARSKGRKRVSNSSA